MNTPAPKSRRSEKDNVSALSFSFLGVNELYVTPNCLSDLLKKENDESYNQNHDCCDSDRTGYRNRSLVRV